MLSKIGGKQDVPDNGVGSDGRAVQDIGDETTVEGRLPVGGSDEGCLAALVWVEETENLELQACRRAKRRKQASAFYALALLREF